ncbi:MAG: DUF1638 domain-containing protein [Defluviitaleaceae bacterium]|nr:DUF1638 domain-containing protein [Defluviitaleaceae bacterium]
MTERYMLIGCEIMHREICLCAALSKNIIDLEFLDKGLHDIGEKAMSEALQQEIDNVNTEKYSAVLLCYGLCNYGVKGLHSSIPIIIPRAHDCITLFLGSKERYRDYFDNNPGTFFRTSGWLERVDFGIEGEENVMSKLGIAPDTDYSEFGEENAEYLREILGDWTSNYKKQTFIDTGIRDTTIYEEQVADDSQANGLEYERVKGNIRLIQELMDGNWDSNDFLVVPPGNEIIASHDENIICCKKRERR